MNKSVFFWEEENSHLPFEKSIWGERSKVFDKILQYFPENANILDLGCGDGRNSIFLALQSKNFHITSVDKSIAQLLRLEKRLNHFSLKNVDIEQSDCRNYMFKKQFDVILLQGALHFINKEDYSKVFSKIEEATNNQGFNLVSDFTNLVPFPSEIKESFISYFERNELIKYYYKKCWDIILYEHYQMQDSHMMDTIHHSHDVCSIFSRKI